MIEQERSFDENKNDEVIINDEEDDEDDMALSVLQQLQKKSELE